MDMRARIRRTWPTTMRVAVGAMLLLALQSAASAAAAAPTAGGAVTAAVIAPQAVAVPAGPLTPVAEEAARAATLQATWVSLSAEASEADGAPAPRCDHALRSLAGLSRRPNAAVPPLSSANSADPYASKLWLYGGWNEEEEFGDSWTLDVDADPPRWSRIHYSADSDPGALHNRWGVPVSFIPDGVDARDAGQGLTALLFGGTGAEQLFGDITSFNLATGAFRTVQPAPATISDAEPFPRGYTQWIQLPVGFGQGAEAIARGGGVDSGCFYLLGGHGAADGVMNGPSHLDWNDEWVFNLTARSWQRLQSQHCLSNVTTCSDEQSMLSLLATTAPGAGDGTGGGGGAEPLDLAAPIRPADVAPTLERLAAALAALNATVAAAGGGLENDPASCRTSCTRYVDANPLLLRPPPLEGTRFTSVDGRLFLFGGYTCLEGGLQIRGGEGCFLGSMWVLDYASMLWTRVDPPVTPADPRWKHWPSRRCFNVLVGHAERGLVLVQGGFYQDTSGVAYYYSDTYAFDVERMDFVSLTVRGIPPLVAWSAAATLRGDDMYLHGGCQGSQFYDQLLVLRIGVAVEAPHCFAGGEGMRGAVAGSEASFVIQTLVSAAPSAPAAASWNGTQPWSANATYGTGLLFSVQLVSTSSTGVVSLVQAEVAEQGAGLYRVFYTPTAGREFHIFASLHGEQLPGSPFPLRVAPQPLPAPERCTAGGWGASIVEKGGRARVRIRVSDAFGNEFGDASFLPPGAVLLQRPPGATPGVAVWMSAADNSTAFFNVSAALGPDVDSMLPLDFSLEDGNGAGENGTIFLSYPVPDAHSSLLLSLRINGAHISGSSFLLAALEPVSLGESVRAALSGLAIAVALVCAFCGACVAFYRGENVMRSSSPTFLFVLIGGSCLSALSVVFLALEGSDRACQAFHTLLSVGLVLAMAALLAKSSRVMRIFTARKLKVPSNLSDARLMVPTLGIALLMLLLNLLWIGTDPVRAELRPAAAHPEVLFFHTCASVHGQSWVVALLAFCGALLLYGVYIAVKTGHVPHQFNESKLIAASVYNVFFCSLIVVPLLFFLGASSDFLIGRIVLQSMVILWCSAFPVLALIAPKMLLLWRRHGGGMAPAAGGTLAAAGGGDEYGTHGPGPSVVLSGLGGDSNATALHHATAAAHARYAVRNSTVAPQPPGIKRGSFMHAHAPAPAGGGFGAAGVSGMGGPPSRRYSTNNGAGVSLAPPTTTRAAALSAHSTSQVVPMESSRACVADQSGGGGGGGGGGSGAPHSHLHVSSARPHHLQHQHHALAPFNTRGSNGTNHATAASSSSATAAAMSIQLSSPTSGGLGSSGSRNRDDAACSPPMQSKGRLMRMSDSANSASGAPGAAMTPHADDEDLHVVYSAPAGAALPSAIASPSDSPPHFAVAERRRLHVGPPATLAPTPAPAPGAGDAVVAFEPSGSASSSPLTSASASPQLQPTGATAVAAALPAATSTHITPSIDFAAAPAAAASSSSSTSSHDRQQSLPGALPRSASLVRRVASGAN